jgi:predicted enzyme related to lactoylglutathione lyase
MTTRRTFHPGQPCWIDTSVPDAPTREALMGFLSGIFGWTFDVSGEDFGYYSMARSGDANVLAIGQQPQGSGQWLVYLATDDVDTAVLDATTAGARIFVEPMEVGGAGTMAVGLDPTGAVFGLWQAGDFAGFEAFGRHGAPCWFDHVSSDPATAASFYANLFGLEVSAMGVGDPIMLMGQLGQESIASFSLADEPGMPAAWMPVLGVASVSETEQAAVALGASVLMSGQSVPGGIASAFAAPGAGTVTLVYESPDLRAE